MSATRRRGPLRAAALLASVLLCPGGRAGAQACSPVFRVAFGVGPPGATVLGAWDFDGDGRPDLLLRTSGEVRVAHDAGGSYSLGAVLSLGDVAVGDFDGDGILDAVSVQVSGASSSVVFLRGDGAGGFRAVSSFPAAAALSGPVVADFDGDGKLDLAAFPGGSAVWLFRGDGRGGFAAPYPLRTSVSSVSRLYALDADADGRSELLVRGSDAFAYDVFATYGVGSGGFFEEVDGPTGGGGSPCPSDVAIGDLDGDGRADAVSADRYEGGCPDRIRTFLVRPGGPVRHVQPAPPFWSPVLADFDGDGRTDLAAIRGSLYGVPTMLAVLPGDAAGAFGPPLLFPVPESVNRETAVLTAADVDGDGRTDLVLSGIPGLSPLVLRNVCGNTHERASPGPPFPVRVRARP